jgi:hypothetical protein
MKSFTFILLLTGSCMVSSAQNELPAFGSIDKADLEMKVCDLDNDAFAYKLLDYGNVRYVGWKRSFKIIIERRVRIKILKNKGFERANIKIQFVSKKNFEKITDIEGVTYNLDSLGNIIITKLDKSSIYKKVIDKRNSEIAFTMPNVKEGSVIEYTFIEQKESPVQLDDWYLQDVIPTRFSMFKILIPGFFHFAIQVIAFDEVEQKRTEEPEETFTPMGRVKYNSAERTYIMRNVLPLRDEPYMSSAKDYLQRIIFQLSSINFAHVETFSSYNSSWWSLIDNLLADEDFGDQFDKNILHLSALDDSLKNVTGDFKKMKFIYDYIRQHISWNGNESIFAPDNLKSAWNNKSGSNAEINLILLGLLKKAGLDAYPLLVSTRDNGEVNKLYPFLQQFNNVMACVFIDTKQYILNAADKYNPAWLIPFDVINTEGLLIDNKKGGWRKLNDDSDFYKNTVSIIAKITSAGIMNGDATVSSFGYSKNIRVKNWEEDKASFKNYFSEPFADITVQKTEVENEDADSMPLVQKIKFSVRVNTSGDYKYFPVNLFQGFGNNPFIADDR